MDMQGKYLENQTLQPDILVYNEPGASLKGEDAQLKAAVDHLLKELSKRNKYINIKKPQIWGFLY